MTLVHLIIELAAEALILAGQHIEHKARRWLYKGDAMDSFSDPYVTRAPETNEELRARYNAAREFTE